MKKKILFMCALSVMLVGSLSACGDVEDNLSSPANSSSETTVTTTESETILTEAGATHSYGFLGTVTEVNDNKSLIIKPQPGKITPDMPEDFAGSGPVYITEDVTVTVENIKQVKCDKDYKTLEITEENYTPTVGDELELTYSNTNNSHDIKDNDGRRVINCFKGVCYVMEKE